MSEPSARLTLVDDTRAKADLHDYLQSAREALVWKLEGLGEYDVKRPMVRTGTNLLGLVKHMAGTDAGYLGDVFGRPFPEPLPWTDDDTQVNADMWATPEESRAEIVALYRRVWAHGDETVAALPLDALGEVPWWGPGRRQVTLHQVLVHLIAETARHAGHADVVRELVDGAAGLRAGNDNMPSVDDGWWVNYRERLEQVARVAGGRP